MDSTKNKIALSNTGIYKIQNIVDMKLYLGSAAVSFTNRFGKHRHDLRKNKHHSVYLQNAWNKYGEDNFIFTPLKVCDAKECIEWEQFFLDLYEPEYNILKVAKIGGYTNQKRSQEFIDKKAKPYLFISPEGQIFSGKNIRKFARDNNLSREGIRSLINKRGKSRSYKGWTTCFKDYLILKYFKCFNAYTEDVKTIINIETSEEKKVFNICDTARQLEVSETSIRDILSGKERKGWKLKNFCDSPC